MPRAPLAIQEWVNDLHLDVSIEYDHDLGPDGTYVRTMRLRPGNGDAFPVFDLFFGYKGALSGSFLIRTASHNPERVMGGLRPTRAAISEVFK